MTAWRACLGKIGRKETINLYKVKLMRPDGTLIFGRCEQPRELIQMPADLRTMDETEKRIRLADRKPSTKQQAVEEITEDTFDFRKYTSHWKKQ